MTHSWAPPVIFPGYAKIPGVQIRKKPAYDGQ